VPDERLGAVGALVRDYRAHLLLPEGNHLAGVLQARCGHLLPVMAAVHDQQPPYSACEHCELIFRADVDNPPRFTRPGALCPMLTGEELVD
jgi:hypothetical protein